MQVEVVFPGKEFMVEKYSPPSPLMGLKRGAQHINTSAYHHIITSNFWWLWYPYRWAIGVKELVKLVMKKRR